MPFARPGLKALIFTIDTEPDDRDWDGLGGRGDIARNMQNIPVLKCLAPLMRDMGLAPTLLATNSVVCSEIFESAVNALGSHGMLEVGMHMHPADTYPFSGTGSDVSDNILTLNTELLLAKLETMYGEMSKRFDAPRTFRGAAWALNSPALHWMVEKKFIADSSVTPGVDWRLRQRPDWTEAPRFPYRMSLDRPYTEDPRSPLIEVPPTIWSPNSLPNLSHRIPGIRSLLTQPLHSSQSLPIRLIRKLRPTAPRWLRPAFENLDGMLEVAHHFSDAPCLHVMIHSNELGLGTSPYSLQSKDADQIWRRLSQALERWIGEGWQPMTLSAFADAWTRTLDTQILPTPCL